MHIAPYDNQNRPIVDVDDAHVPLTYFNIVKLKAGEHFDYRVPGYETCVVPATGTVTVETGGETFFRGPHELARRQILKHFGRNPEAFHGAAASLGGLPPICEPAG